MPKLLCDQSAGKFISSYDSNAGFFGFFFLKDFCFVFSPMHWIRRVGFIDKSFILHPYI